MRIQILVRTNAMVHYGHLMLLHRFPALMCSFTKLSGTVEIEIEKYSLG
jgi:hypothetical protein